MSDGGKGDGRRPDPQGNYRAKYDGIDWSAKGDKPKDQKPEKESQEQQEEKE